MANNIYPTYDTYANKKRAIERGFNPNNEDNRDYLPDLILSIPETEKAHPDWFDRFTGKTKQTFINKYGANPDNALLDEINKALAPRPIWNGADDGNRDYLPYNPVNMSIFPTPNAGAGYDNKYDYINSLLDAGAFYDPIVDYWDRTYYLPKSATSKVIPLYDQNPSEDDGGWGGTLGALAGIALAPLTGGSSLLMGGLGGAAGSMLGGGGIDDALKSGALGAISGLGVGSLFGSGGMLGTTGSKLGDTILSGVTKGAVGSAISGGDPIKGALSGGISGGINSALPTINAGTDSFNKIANNILRGTVSGGIGAGIYGNDIGKGMLSGSISGGLSSANRAFGGDEIGGMLANLVGTEIKKDLFGSKKSQPSRRQPPPQAKRKPPQQSMLTARKPPPESAKKRSV